MLKTEKETTALIYRVAKFVPISLVLVFALILRVNHLGEDSFWIDEVEQALAAIQPTLHGTILVVKSHVMAMPLDYLISRMMALISLDETVMRLPAAIWGTLTIPVFYFFVQDLDEKAGNRTALIASFLLCLSPVHIEYSQEMRYYASLLFFYTTASFFLFKYLSKGGTSYRLLYILSATIGAYFHPYVLMVVINEFIYLVLHEGVTRSSYKKFLSAALCTLLLFLLFLPGYLYFGGGESYNAKMDRDTGYSNFILEGLGLHARHYTSVLPSMGAWHFVLCISLLAGLFFIIANLGRYSAAISFIAGGAIQVAIILSFDYFYGYFLVSRQIIHLAPTVVMLPSAIGMDRLLGFIKKRQARTLALIITLICMTYWSFPYISTYYSYQKSGAREVVEKIMANYQTNEGVVLVSPVSSKVYGYYFYKLYHKSDAKILVLNQTDVSQQIKNHRDIIYVVLPKTANLEERKAIRQLGFNQMQTANPAEFLFIRKSKK